MADENTRAVDEDEQEADATGGDSAEGKTEQREQTDDPPAGEGAEQGGDDSDEDGSGDEDQSEEAIKAKKAEEEREQARETMEKIEEDPPGDLEEWPDDAAKYETFGGAEGEHSYDDGPETKLGPSSLRHLEDGRVTIEGEEVDDPDQYKGDPIPGGPTDPDSGQDLTSEKIREKQGRDLEGEGEGDDSEASSDDDSGDSDSSDSEASSDDDSGDREEEKAEQSS